MIRCQLDYRRASKECERLLRKLGKTGNTDYAKYAQLSDEMEEYREKVKTSYKSSEVKL